MAGLKRHFYLTRTGRVSLVFAPLSYPARPVVVFLHGALRDAGLLSPWVRLLADTADVVLVDLPGHGHSEPIEPATVDAMATAVLETLQQALSSRQLLLVGESLGGTIALALGGMANPTWVRGVLAADPPLTTAKLWTLTDYFRKVIAREPGNAFIRILGRDAFGISETDVAEISYYPLLGKIRAPTIIATGDVPLEPRRVVEDAPCVFDVADRSYVESHHSDMITVHQFFDCPHMLLVDERLLCLSLIKQLLEDHFTGDQR